MKRKIRLLLLPLYLASLPIMLAQEESAVIVDPPRISKTVVTNWVLLEVRYTVRYMDGYEPRWDLAEPQSLSFGVWELDPELGNKLIKENERQKENKNKKQDQNSKPEIEHYVDLVYYLRHIGPNKGEIEIPEQVFSYVEPGPKGQYAGREVKQVKVPGIKQNYVSTLTKDADDIKDVMDFGSFKKQERAWKISAVAGFLASVAILWLLIFRKPVVSRSERKKLKAGRVSPVMAENQIILKPNVARRLLAKQIMSWSANLALDKTNPEKVKKELCNLLRDQFLPAYVPEMLDSDTPREIRQKIDKIPSSRVRGLLTIVSNHLEYHDDALYKQSGWGGVGTDLQALLKTVKSLRPERIFWFNIKARAKKLKTSSLKMLARLRGAK